MARVDRLDPVAVRVPLGRDARLVAWRRVVPEGVTAARSLPRSLSIRRLVLSASRGVPGPCGSAPYRRPRAATQVLTESAEEPLRHPPAASRHGRHAACSRRRGADRVVGAPLVERAAAYGLWSVSQRACPPPRSVLTCAEKLGAQRVHCQAARSDWFHCTSCCSSRRSLCRSPAVTSRCGGRPTQHPVTATRPVLHRVPRVKMLARAGAVLVQPRWWSYSPASDRTTCELSLRATLLGHYAGQRSARVPVSTASPLPRQPHALIKPSRAKPSPDSDAGGVVSVVSRRSGGTSVD